MVKWWREVGFVVLIRFEKWARGTRSSIDKVAVTKTVGFEA